MLHSVSYSSILRRISMVEIRAAVDILLLSSVVAMFAARDRDRDRDRDRETFLNANS